MRWQVELLFKECKSYNNLHGFQTSNETLQEAVIYASLIATTLKRFITGCIEKIFLVEMSTFKVAKTTSLWWMNLISAIINKQRKRLVKVVEDTFHFLHNNARRAHPKRDRVSGLFQFFIEPDL